MDKLNVLLLGGGGREHALAWKIAQSELLNKLYIAPGNGGTWQHGINLNFSETDFPAIKDAILTHDVKLLVIGPEGPLVKGIREYIACDSATEHVRIIGPGRDGAKLEGSKSFSKEFMKRHKIPTARYRHFASDQLAEAKEFLSEFKPPFVLKADGLAAGKGVLIIDDIKEARLALEDILKGGKFGAAGSTVVIEEFLSGIELSVFLLTDGKSYITLPAAKDYKRIGEGDTGLNTGGMGSISPVKFADEAFMKKVDELISKPTILGLQKDKIDYTGFVFIGLMNLNGEPQVIEYNCRMGDPETESVMPRITSDFLEMLWNCGGRELGKSALKVDPRTVASVMVVSGGYPEEYEKGKYISGLENVNESIIFQSGTKITDGLLYTNGGRVLTVTSYGDSLDQALEKSYCQLNHIFFEKINYRKDIGFDLIEN
jgi:phosphoribosylamine---glycine ligase